MVFTQKKIARALGVSTATVSMALRDSPRLSEGTRKKVKDFAESEKYRTDLNALSLKTGRSRTIGLIVGSLRSPFYGKLISELQRLFRLRQYLGIAITVEEFGSGGAAIETLLSHRVGGIISVTLNEEETRTVHDSQTPMVIYGYSKGPSVQLDEYHGSQLATRHLLELGHSQIAFIGNTDDDDPRFVGFRDSLMARGKKFVRDFTVEPDNRDHIRGGYQAMRQLLSGKCPDAVVCRNDILAIGAIRAIKEAGLSVPDDVSITGFDDTDLGAAMPVALTSVAVDIPGIAAALTEQLFDLIEDRPNSQAVRKITPKLVIRESTKKSGRI